MREAPGVAASAHEKEVYRIVHDTFGRFLCNFAGFLVPSCPKRVLVWGTVVRGLRIKIFVRVLHSSRVNLNNVNNTNVFCCV